MKRSDIIRSCINDCAHGEKHSLIGLIDWLIIDLDLDLGRILKIGEKRFGIPREIALKTMMTLV